MKSAAPRSTPAGAVLLLLSVMLLSACGSRAHYYRLSAEAPARHGRTSVSVGVGPVTLPGYVDRRELVYASRPNEFAIPPDALWASPLRENMTRVLTEDLRRLLGSREVVSYPWSGRRAPAQQVVLDVRRFHALSGKYAVLDVGWRITNASGGVRSRHSASLREPIDGDGYAPVVAAQSRLLARCAERIAASL